MKKVQSLKVRAGRTRRRVETFLDRSDGREIGAQVTNVSNHGCELQPQEALSVEEQVRIEVPRLGSIVATIRWVSEGRAGAEFVLHSDVWEEVRPAS